MYRKRSEGWTKHWDFMLADLITMELAFVFAYFIRHGLNSPFAIGLYRQEAIVLVIMELMVVFLTSTFSGVLRRTKYMELGVTFRQVAFTMGLSMLYLVSTKQAQNYSRITFAMTGVIYFCLSYVVRVILKRIIRHHNISWERYSIMIVTTKALALEAVTNLTKSGRYSKMVLALIDAPEALEVGNVKVVSDGKNVLNYLATDWVDEVFMLLPDDVSIPKDTINSILEMGITIHMNLARLYSSKGQKVIVEEMDNRLIITSSLNIISSKRMLYKRTLDIVGGFLGCILTGILFIFVAPAIYIKDPGPIFFTQTRVGRNGKRFKIHKFRTMYVGAEAKKKELLSKNEVKDGRMFKISNDPRIIGSEKSTSDKRKGLGNFLRSTSIDEFPQFFNVLKGDMSLVGTRPPTEDEWSKYELHHRRRLSSKPGITGLWQVTNRSYTVDFEEVVKLDSEYIINWSLGLDFKIIFKTLGVMIRREGK
ncbi:MAG: sugar transferase [Lachnospiraceae bacterium]|jgi:exopolysaccharide biosynthesis polyprenyl glycosylphosphotransferase|nr:sugar transferase [Lachnospiraceae bacterium]